MVNEEANEIKQQQAANPQEEIDATTAQVLELAENTEAETTDVHTVDYSTFQKNDFVELLSKLLDDVKEQPSVAAFRKSEDVLKEVRPLFEQFKTAERAEALAKFKEANDGSEDGFEFKFDETIEKFDKLFKALKEERAKYFNQIEKERDKNFSQKLSFLTALELLLKEKTILILLKSKQVLLNSKRFKMNGNQLVTSTRLTTILCGKPIMP